MDVLFIILIQNFFQKIYIISSFSFLQVVSDINVQKATFEDDLVGTEHSSISRDILLCSVSIPVGTSEDSPLD